MQLKTLPAGLDNLHIPSDDDRRRMFEIANASGSGGDSGEGKRKWRRGEVEFEAFMRHLDNAVSFCFYMYVMCTVHVLSLPFMESLKVEVCESCSYYFFGRVIKLRELLSSLQGYRTGYIYHEPVLRQDRRRMDRANSEVEIPPTATSFSDTWDGEGP